MLTVQQVLAGRTWQTRVGGVLAAALGWRLAYVVIQISLATLAGTPGILSRGPLELARFLALEPLANGALFALANSASERLPSLGTRPLPFPSLPMSLATTLLAMGATLVL